MIAGNIKQSLTMIASIPTTTLSRNRNSDSPTNSVIDLKEKELDEKSLQS
ncbi:hypothetical protein QE177_02930 [Arsenophonus sp. aPb]|nr:hypothetical protein [Arsenophonus sp. aPb]WGL98870.1 hypothetical protein QE177_02930 [Arsenophonus sp. aPb]